MCPGIICLFHTTHLFFVIENPAHIVGPILVSNNDLIHWYHWFRLKQEGLIYYQSAFIGLENLETFAVLLLRERDSIL